MSVPPSGGSGLGQHAPQPAVSPRMELKLNLELPVSRSCGRLGGGSVPWVQTQSLGFNVMEEEPDVCNDTAGLEVCAVSHPVGREPGQICISLSKGPGELPFGDLSVGLHDP